MVSDYKMWSNYFKDYRSLLRIYLTSFCLLQCFLTCNWQDGYLYRLRCSLFSLQAWDPYHFQGLRGVFEVMSCHHWELLDLRRPLTPLWDASFCRLFGTPWWWSWKCRGCFSSSGFVTPSRLLWDRSSRWIRWLGCRWRRCQCLWRSCQLI